MKQLLSLKAIRIFLICWIAYSLITSVGIYYIFEKIVSLIPESMASVRRPMQVLLLALPEICWKGFITNIFVLLYACLIAYLLIRYKSEKPQADLFFKTFAFLYIGQVAGSSIRSTVLNKELENMVANEKDPMLVFNWMAVHAGEMILYGLAGSLLAGILVFVLYKSKKQISEEVV